MDIAPKISEQDVINLNKILNALSTSNFLIDDKAYKLLACSEKELEHYKNIVTHYGGAKLNSYNYLMVNNETCRYHATNKYQSIFEAQEIEAKKSNLSLENISVPLKWDELNN